MRIKASIKGINLSFDSIYFNFEFGPFTLLPGEVIGDKFRF
jgi:hypothetical protein